MDHRKLAISVGLASLLAGPLAAQQDPGARQQPVGAQLAGEAAPGGAALTARLVDADANAGRGMARVRVDVSSLKTRRGQKGQAQLHYRIDNAPTFSTEDSELMFHGLPRGLHNVEITPVDAEHRPIGGAVQVPILIP